MNRMLFPSLWRTCRVLSNPARLRVLQTVCQQPGASVCDVQRACHLPQSSASQLLRQLQARGLLKAAPKGRYVRYTPATDPAVGHADAVHAAICSALTRHDSAADIRHTLRGMTHTRRLAIIRALQRQPMISSMLVSTCRISKPAVHRHLTTLVACGFVMEDADGTFRIIKTLSPLARELVRIACSE